VLFCRLPLPPPEADPKHSAETNSEGTGFEVAMRPGPRIKQGLMGAVVATLLVTGAAAAEPADAVLYELSEFMQLVTHGPVTQRTAIAGLSGFAALNTPLCPSEAMVYGNGQCYVNAIGTDSINTATGKGPLSGKFAVVVQGDNPADGPEYGVMHGTFWGEMDLSVAQTTGLGRITGIMRRSGGGRKPSFPFTGVVRLPVPCGPDGQVCYVTSGPDGTPTGTVPLDPLEYVLGAGTVRMDIWFR
jgi:hypothetical protein